MGQFTLGLRSLLIRSTIFVVMAALLAWALGGTLFPRPATSDFLAQRVQFNGGKWHWRLLVGGKNAGEVRWNLMREDDRGEAKPFVETRFVEVIGPIAGDDGLYYAGRNVDSEKAWQIARVDNAGQTQTWTLPDRLAAAQQMARVEAGLPLQDERTIDRQRIRVLDPPENSADEGRRRPNADATSRPS